MAITFFLKLFEVPLMFFSFVEVVMTLTNDPGDLDKSWVSIRGYGKKSDLRSVGVCRSIFTLNWNLWKAQILRRNIKIHGELVPLIFHSSKIRKVSTFHFRSYWKRP